MAYRGRAPKSFERGSLHKQANGRGAGLGQKRNAGPEHPLVAVPDAVYTPNWPRVRKNGPPRRQISHPRMVATRVATAKKADWFMKAALSTSAEKQRRRAERAASAEIRTAALIANGTVRPDSAGIGTTQQSAA